MLERIIAWSVSSCAVKVLLVVAHARLPRRVANAHAVPNGYEELGERPVVAVYSCGAPAARVLCALIGVVEEVRLVQRGRHIFDLFDARDVAHRAAACAQALAHRAPTLSCLRDRGGVTL